MKSVSEEQLRAYFLGKLPEADAENLEMDYAASAELTEEAQTIERELADDYLRGNLSSADARLFETNYLITEARRKRLAVSEGLWRIAGEQKARSATAAIGSPNSIWQTIFGKRYRFQLVLTCLLLLLVFGGLFCYSLILKVDKNEVSEVKDVDQLRKIEIPPVKNPEANNQDLKVGSSNSVVPNKEASKSLTLPAKIPSEARPLPVPKNIEKNTPGLAVFTLTPSALRDEGEQSIAIAPNVKNVKLQLKLPEEANNYKIFRAVLKTPDDDPVYTSPNSKSPGLTITVDKLENRTYIIYLEGQNPQSEFESVTEYTFRVRR